MTGPGRSVTQWLFSWRQILWRDCFHLRVDVECQYFNIGNIQVHSHHFLWLLVHYYWSSMPFLRKLSIYGSLLDSLFHIKANVMWTSFNCGGVRWLLTQNKTLALCHWMRDFFPKEGLGITTCQTHPILFDWSLRSLPRPPRDHHKFFCSQSN